MISNQSPWRPTVAAEPTGVSLRGTSRARGPCRWLIALLAASCCLPLGGCLSPNRPHALGNLVDGAYSDFRERVWARRAFNQQYGHMPRKFREHFRKGFVEGYCNVCNGGDGYVPAMPPKEYWGYEFQSSDGAECVSAWFDGYPDGVAAARKNNAGKNADMYISSMIERAVQQERDGVRLASQVSITRNPDSKTRVAEVPAGDKAPATESAAPPPPPTSSRQKPVAPKTSSGKPEAAPVQLLVPLAPLAPAEPSMVIGQGDF